MKGKNNKTYRAAVSPINLIFWVLIGLGLYWFFVIQLAWPSVWPILAIPLFFIARFFYLALRVFTLDQHAVTSKFIISLEEIPYVSVRSTHRQENLFSRQLLLGAPRESVFIAYNKYDYSNYSVLNPADFEKELKKRVPELSSIAHFEY